MKVLYLTVPSFFDLEISLIRELSQVCDISVVMIVSPESMHSSAFSIDSLAHNCCLLKANECEWMQQYASLIDLDRWIIANNPDNSVSSCFRLAKQIKGYIKKGRFDIIHSTTGCKTSLFLLPFIRQQKNTLYTLHDPIPHGKLSVLAKFFKYDAVIYCYKNLLLLSKSLEHEFIQTNRGKYKHIYHSRLSVYDFLSYFPLDNNRYGKYILFFGRIDHYKGVDLLVDAFRNTQAYRNGVKLVIAGKVLRGVELAINDEEQIITLNRYIPNEELATLISHCLFVVLPYRSATQSGCLFSAYAFNKPVLVTNVGDLPKQVNEETGMIIAPNDTDKISHGIDGMINKDLDEMSQKINERYSANGQEGWATIARELIETYKSIIESV